jgi:hypothetical protein
MLKSMGWRPGTGLGPANSTNRSSTAGLLSPIVAVKRPQKLGLGYDLSQK